MSEDVFYTTFQIPDTMQSIRLRELMNFLADNRSVASHGFNGRKGTLTIVIANRYSSLKYSDCPLTGTHDFATGWLAHEAMLTISKFLGRPLFWLEGEFYKDNQRLEHRSYRSRNKPPVKIDWEEFSDDVATVSSTPLTPNESNYFAWERESRVLSEVLAERRRQDQKWGGPDHDDEHPLIEWIELINPEMIKARLATPTDPTEFRKQMIRIAAVAVAAVGSYDRKIDK